MFDVVYAVADNSSPPPPPLHSATLRTLTIRLAPLFPQIVDDKYGSFVGERIWKWSDGYMKVGGFVYGCPAVNKD